MGKYSEIPRSPRDYYRTIDTKATRILNTHLPPDSVFCEPCAGAGDLIDQLAELGHWCPYACDIEPQRSDIEKRDLFDIRHQETGMFDFFITNPPFTRAILVELIPHLSAMRPTWLLLPGDLVHNLYMREHMTHCVKFVSIGRMHWVENKINGKENYAWYLFDQEYTGPTELIARWT